MIRPSRLAHAVGAIVAAAALSACSNQADRSPLAIERATTTAPTTTTEAPTTTTTTTPFDPFALRPPPAADDPAALAAQISAAETALRDTSSSPEVMARAALAQQVAYRQLGIHPEWDAAVNAALPQQLRHSAQLQTAARREFRAMHKVFPTEVPDWRIVAPDPADTLIAAYKDAEVAFGIPWRFLAAINLVETGLGRIRGTSVANAQGPMQFLPATWDAYGGGGDINDTHDAIMGAGRYLAANNGATDIDNALYRYNHSDRYVRGVRLYADLIAEHPRAFDAFYHWGVWYATDQGDLYLPVGYDEPTRVPVSDYLARG